MPLLRRETDGKTARRAEAGAAYARTRFEPKPRTQAEYDERKERAERKKLLVRGYIRPGVGRRWAVFEYVVAVKKVRLLALDFTSEAEALAFATAKDVDRVMVSFAGAKRIMKLKAGLLTPDTTIATPGSRLL